MKKLLAFMLISVFLAPFTVISTERKQSKYFDKIPVNPNFSQTISTFPTQNLTGKTQKLAPNSSFKIKELTINKKKIPIFKLSNGRFIKASRSNIYEDVVLKKMNYDRNYWLKANFSIYNTPYTVSAEKINTKLTSFSKVHVSQRAVTKHGVYMKVDNQGWVAEKKLSLQDNRMEKVQNLLNKKYNKANYSIYVKQLRTQKSAGINSNKVMYSASVTKLPILYFTERQIQEGKFKLSDKLKYVEQVNHFKGAYKVEGSGEMPKKADNKNYTVDYLLKAVAQHSDNVASNILGYYIAHKYDEAYQTTITKAVKTNWNMEKRDVSSKTAATIMESLYSQKDLILKYLSSTDFDNTRISRDITVPVAHKIGDAYDYKHDVAVVYAGEPFILSIFTDKASYENITTIANDVYGVLK